MNMASWTTRITNDVDLGVSTLGLIGDAGGVWGAATENKGLRGLTTSRVGGAGTAVPSLSVLGRADSAFRNGDINRDICCFVMGMVLPCWVRRAVSVFLSGDVARGTARDCDFGRGG
jgi:hypothetical protein